jgi:probable phosphoglycerate mutase
MFIYFVRHGETPGNQQKFHQSAETPLAPEGEMQAVNVAERLQAITLNEIWASPLRRAQQTAQAINEYQNVPLKTEELLHEIKRPSMYEGKPHNDPALQALAHLTWENSADLAASHEDGESFTHVTERMREVKTLLENYAKDKPADYTLCIVSHGTVLAILLLHILLNEHATPAVLRDAVLRMKMNNTGISLARIETQDGQQTWKFLTFNDYAHL